MRKSCGSSNARGATREKCVGGRGEVVFFFLRKRLMRYLLVLQVVAAGRSYRGLMVWCGHRRGNGACAAAVAQGHKPSLQRVATCGRVPAYPAYIPQIPMRGRRAKGMDGCLFSLTLYIQYIIKFGGCQKWKLEEKGKSGKFWKVRDCGRWIRGKGCVGGNGREVRWLPPKVPFLTFLQFYGILTVFSRREQKERIIL